MTLETLSPYLPSRYFSGDVPDEITGLLGVGGVLSVSWLIDAYSHGIFL
jgi:hypothetical protein